MKKSFFYSQLSSYKKLKNHILTLYPDIEKCCGVKIMEHHHISPAISLIFRTHGRSTKIIYNKHDKYPTANFYWDNSFIFKILLKSSDQFLTLKYWLSDFLLPSSIEQKLPWLNTGKLAKYFEEGKGVEGEFLLSWDDTEDFYKQTDFPQIPAILKLITKMRHNNYDHLFRAGTSLLNLIVSRSRRHGLRDDQSFIGFVFMEKDMNVFYQNKNKRESL